jgi:hypothetical protein
VTHELAKLVNRHNLGHPPTRQPDHSAYAALCPPRLPCFRPFFVSFVTFCSNCIVSAPPRLRVKFVPPGPDGRPVRANHFHASSFALDQTSPFLPPPSRHFSHVHTFAPSQIPSSALGALRALGVVLSAIGHLPPRVDGRPPREFSSAASATSAMHIRKSSFSQQAFLASNP